MLQRGHLQAAYRQVWPIHVQFFFSFLKLVGVAYIKVRSIVRNLWYIYKSQIKHVLQEYYCRLLFTAAFIKNKPGSRITKQSRPA